jgi:hypothetical protein
MRENNILLLNIQNVSLMGNRVSRLITTQPRQSKLPRLTE